jgi:hypothetical protein
MEISFSFDQAINNLFKYFNKDKIAFSHYLENIAKEASGLSAIWSEIYKKILVEYKSIQNNNVIADKEFLNDMKDIFLDYFPPSNDIGYHNCLRYYNDLEKMFDLKISENTLQYSIHALGRIIFMRDQAFDKVEDIINDFLSMTVSNDKILDLAQFVNSLREDAAKLEYISKTYKINYNIID